MDVKLVGFDFRGHTRGTLVVGIAYGCPYYKGSAIFSLVFLSTTSEKSFIPYKTSAAVQAHKVCPLWPRVLSRLSSSAKSLVQLGNTLTQSGCGCLKKYLQLSILLPLSSHKLHTFPKIHTQKEKKSWGITLLEKLRAADES